MIKHLSSIYSRGEKRIKKKENKQRPLRLDNIGQ